MRKHQHHSTSKLLTVLFVFLVLPGIFLLRYVQRVQGAASSTSYSIYDGSLAAGWENWSRTSSVNLANPSQVYSGTASIAFTPTRQWAGLYLHTNTAVDISPYTFLQFAARSSRTRLTYDVMLFGAGNQALTHVHLAHYGGSPVPGRWKVYNIPLANLGATATRISGVVIQSSTRRRGTLYLASINFTSSDASLAPALSPASDPAGTGFTPIPTLSPSSDPAGIGLMPTPALSPASDPAGTGPAPTPTLSPATTSTATVTAGSTGVFITLPPGSALPGDAECAARVSRSSWEPRPGNTTANNVNVYAQGYRLQPAPNYDTSYFYSSRVTGNFTGTTDEIIQWAACKWGFDVDSVRAQAVQESNWNQSHLGDCNGGTVAETHGCQSVGMLQVKGANLPPTFPGTWPYAYESTAFNIDFALAVRRACFDGKITWLSNGYHAGDLWGCIGHWFSGGWNDQGANNYMKSVQAIYSNRPWLKPGF